MVMFGSPTSRALINTENALQKIRTPYESLTPEQLEKRFGQFKMPPHYHGLLDYEAGILKSHRSLVAYQVSAIHVRKSKFCFYLSCNLIEFHFIAMSF